MATGLWLLFSVRACNRLAIASATVYGIIAVALWLTSSPLLDLLVIAAVPLITLIVILNKLTHKFVTSERDLIINYFAIVGIATGIVALVVSLTPLYLSQEMSAGIRNYAHDIYVLSASLSPILLILISMSFPIKLIVHGLVKSASGIKNTLKNNVLTEDHDVTKTKQILLLVAFMSLSATMVIIPHNNAVNFDGKDVGVDTHYYVEWTHLLANSTSLEQFVNLTFIQIQHGDRPFTLLFFVGLSKFVATDQLSVVFDHVPVILTPCLVLVTFFLTRQLTSNKIASLFSAFLTAISFQSLIGIYSGAYSNLMGLIVGYISMIFLFRSLKKNSILNLSIFFGLVITLLFTHIYTWTIIVLIMGTFLLVQLKIKSFSKRAVYLLLILLLSAVLIDGVRMIATGSYSGVSYELSPPTDSDLQLNFGQYTNRWNSIIDTTLSYYGSLFGNSIIYSLCIYWLIRSKFKESSTIFLIIFLSIGSIPLFFGNWNVQARVFYDIPFQIPAGIALMYIFNKPNGVIRIMPICIWLIAVAISALTNFYFIPP